MTEELKPCPFCGLDAALIENYEPHYGRTFYHVKCDWPEHCHAAPKSTTSSNKEYAIEMWNKRWKGN